MYCTLSTLTFDPPLFEGMPPVCVEDLRPGPDGRAVGQGGASGTRVLTPTTEYVAQSVIWAAPTFLLRYLMDNPPPDAGAITYSPWITANLTFHRLLGYVVATHQSMRTHIERAVWT